MLANLYRIHNAHKQRLQVIPKSLGVPDIDVPVGIQDQASDF
jgi:hypothetical protein